MEEITRNFESPSVPTAARLALQWGSGGESRVSEKDREDICDAVDECEPGNYRNVFPLHGPFGALQLDKNHRTIWLYTEGGAYIAGELVDPALLTVRSVPSTGDVNISSLPRDIQAGIMELIRGASRKK